MLTRGVPVKVSAAGVGALLILGGLETAGRRQPELMPVQWQVQQFAIDYPFHVLPDAELGFTMPPNQREAIRTRDYTFLFETDANGYPNRDPWPRDPSLVFLGDSLIVGTGVGLDAGAIGLLSEMLPNQSIVNLGLPGAGPERQARIYRRYGREWRPDLVVSCVFLASDVENDMHFVSWLRDGKRIEYEDYRLRLARAAHNRSIFQRLLDKSLVFHRTVQPLLNRMDRKDTLPERFRFADGTETLFGRYPLEFVAEAVAADDPRVHAFLDSVGKLRALVEQNGASFLLLLIPSKEEIFGGAASTRRPNLASRIKKALASMDAPVLDLYPVLQRRGSEQAPYFSRDFHLNAFGNRVVAEEFAVWFEWHHQVLRPDGTGRNALPASIGHRE